MSRLSNQLRQVETLDWMQRWTLCRYIETSSTAAGTMNCTRGEVGNLNSIKVPSDGSRQLHRYNHAALTAFPKPGEARRTEREMYMDGAQTGRAPD